MEVTEKSQDEHGWASLPEDILVLICALCSIPEISSLSRSNKAYHKIIPNNVRIWRRAWRNSGFVRVRTAQEKLLDPPADRAAAPKSSVAKYYNRIRECATSKQNMRRGAAAVITDLGTVEAFIESFSKHFPSRQMACCALQFAEVRAQLQSETRIFIQILTSFVAPLALDY